MWSTGVCYSQVLLHVASGNSKGPGANPCLTTEKVHCVRGHFARE